MSCLIDQKAEEVSFTRLRGVNRIRTGLPDLWVPNPTFTGVTGLFTRVAGSFTGVMRLMLTRDSFRATVIQFASYTCGIFPSFARESDGLATSSSSTNGSQNPASAELQTVID